MKEYKVRHTDKDYKGFQQFTEDLKIAQTTETELSRLLSSKTTFKVHSYNDDYRYDTLLVDSKGKYIKLEIKEDFGCTKTGNVALEFSCRGKDSGITTTEAHMYLYKIHTRKGIINALMKVSDIKELIRSKQYHRAVNGGDPGSNTMNYLFKLDVFLGICVIL